jgi:hypothetical protein
VLKKSSYDEAMHLAQKYDVKPPCNYKSSFSAFQQICPIAHLQHDANPESLQIPTALIHRELPAIDEEHLGSMKKLAMNNIKRFSRHRGKDEIRQDAKALVWNGLVSDFAHHIIMNVFELISKKIRHLRRKK